MPNIDLVKVVVIIAVIVLIGVLVSAALGSPWAAWSADAIDYLRMKPDNVSGNDPAYSPWSLTVAIFDTVWAADTRGTDLGYAVFGSMATFLIVFIGAWLLLRWVLRAAKG